MEIEIEPKILQYMGKNEVTEKLREMRNRNQTRLHLNLSSIREYSEDLYKYIITFPSKAIPMFESELKSLVKERIERPDSQKSKYIDKSLIIQEPELIYRITFEGMFGKNMVTPRGLNATLTNQLVCVQGIVTRMSIVRPKLINSAHYCDDTKSGFFKEYVDQFSLSNNVSKNMINQTDPSYITNIIPTKDINNNPLSFEYGYSIFRDFQILLVQEPPERTPVGQLPRSVEVILEDDLVDKIKPGDRVQLVGLFKCVPIKTTISSGLFRTVILASQINSITAEAEALKISGYELTQIKNIAKREDCLALLADSLAPSIYGNDEIKKACILQLLGGYEKNLENGTHLRGDINLLLIGDPSTAKSQFLRHMISISPNAINTTGRGSSGVGLTAAVVIDKDTGERHLEAGAMVLGDRGLVCIDEFDKMNDLDRVAIHEVMEQQTVTIAKAGIHCSLNARCSVLAAANPIYGEYQKDLSASKNIGLPDSLLSRFDLVFIVLDEESSELDRLIADRVVRNHMYPADTPTLLSVLDEKIIEADISNDNPNELTEEIFEKHNPVLHGKIKKDILKKSFLKKYIQYAKVGPNKAPPCLSDEAALYISNCWSKLRNFDEENDSNFRAVPITVRTLETLIRLSTAHAKIRLAKSVNQEDCEAAMELMNYALFHEKKENMNFVEMNDSEDNAEKQGSKVSKQSRKSNEKKHNYIVENENEVENRASKGKEGKKSKTKQLAKENEKIDQLFESKLSVEAVITEEQMKYVRKVIIDVIKRQGKEANIDQVWNEIEKSPNYKTYCSDKSVLFDIIIALDRDSKIFYSHESKEIFLL